LSQSISNMADMLLAGKSNSVVKEKRKFGFRVPAKKQKS
jgi:hypothetical protein